MKKQLQVIAVLIQGKKCLVDTTESMVLYNGNWYEMQMDQEGEFYIIANNKTLYINAYYYKENE